MIDEDTPHQACSIGGCPSVTEFCSYSASCPSATEHGDGIIVVGTIAAGLAQQVRRADGRILSETIAPNETAVLIPSSLLSELPEVKRLREESGQLRQGCRNLCDTLDSVIHEDSDKSEEKKVGDRVIASELLRIFRTFLAQSSSPQAEEKA